MIQRIIKGMNSIEWAKRNKKSIVADIVGDAVAPSGDKTPVAIFAAGIPGAGKTEFLNRLFQNTQNIVRVDMDEIVKLFPEYSPENYYKFRGAAAIIVDEVVAYCRKHRLDFVLDGTFGSKRATDNIRSALKRHSVTIYYVWKEPTLAWRHTKDRQIVEKRGIEKEGLVESCINVPLNLQEATSKFQDKISIVAIRKNPNSDEFQATQNTHQIDKLVEVNYTKSDLERTLE